MVGTPDPPIGMTSTMWRCSPKLSERGLGESRRAQPGLGLGRRARVPEGPASPPGGRQPAASLPPGAPAPGSISFVQWPSAMRSSARPGRIGTRSSWASGFHRLRGGRFPDPARGPGDRGPSPGALPLERVLGKDVGAAVGAFHRANGVELLNRDSDHRLRGDRAGAGGRDRHRRGGRLRLRGGRHRDRARHNSSYEGPCSLARTGILRRSVCRADLDADHREVAGDAIAGGGHGRLHPLGPLEGGDLSLGGSAALRRSRVKCADRRADVLAENPFQG